MILASFYRKSIYVHFVYIDMNQAKCEAICKVPSSRAFKKKVKNPDLNLTNLLRTELYLTSMYVLILDCLLTYVCYTWHSHVLLLIWSCWCLSITALKKARFNVAPNQPPTVQLPYSHHYFLIKHLALSDIITWKIHSTVHASLYLHLGSGENNWCWCNSNKVLWWRDIFDISF